MSLRWVQVERSFVEGTTPSDAAAKLGITEDEVIGKSLRAWAWSLEHAAPKGLVAGPGAIRAIERAAHWSGKAGSFVEALPAIFEVRPDGVGFLGWVERYGAYLKEQQRDIARKRNKRTSTRTSDGFPAGLPVGLPVGLPADSDVKRDACPADVPPESLSPLYSSSSVSSFKKRAGVDASHWEAPPGWLADEISDAFKRVRGRPYRWTTLDEARLGEILNESEEEILRRWELALKRVTWPACTCVVDLVKHWNAYATEERRPQKAGARVEVSDAELRESASQMVTDENGDFVL